MNTKQTIEINVPEGYEVAEGVQPRAGEQGEYIWLTTWSTPCKATGKQFGKHIILKKKAPEYFKAKYYEKLTDEFCYDVVEIKALEDALSLVRRLQNQILNTNLTGLLEDQVDTLQALKALVNGK